MANLCGSLAFTLLNSVLVQQSAGYRIRKSSKRSVASACSGPVTSIPVARGMVSSPVTVRGVVTADYREGLSGYYMQDISGDGNPNTSDGIFVFDTTTNVYPGLLLELTGTVESFYDNIQITNVASPKACGVHAIPPPVSVQRLPTRAEAPGTWKRLAGMVVTLTEPADIVDIYSLARYGEIKLSSGRNTQASQVVDPLSPEHEDMLSQFRDTIILDDGSTAQNPNPIPFPRGGFSYDNHIRTGDQMANVTGVITYRHGQYRLDVHPGGDAMAPVHIRSNPRPETPPAVGGRIKVSTFNVENYFVGLPLGVPFSEGRGANNVEEFHKQRAKVISAMSALDADVFALMEVENLGNGPDSAVQNIVAELNRVTVAGNYVAVALPGTIGGDVIACNFIFKPSKVRVVGSPAILDSSVDPAFMDTKNRPSLAISFEEVDSGRRFTVAANHLKSKGSSCEECCNDPEIDGVGNCNVVRTNAARAIGKWLTTDPTRAGADDILVTGDMNSYHYESPIQTLIREFGFVDLIDTFDGKEKGYSYVYGGLTGYLDHALASPSLASKITGVKDWHINADEHYFLGYSEKYKTSAQIQETYNPGPFRCSDHDPLLLGMF